LSVHRRLRRLLALGNSRKRLLRKQKKREKTCGDSNSKEISTEDREARYRKARILLKNAIAKVKERKVRLFHIYIYKRL